MLSEALKAAVTSGEKVLCFFKTERLVALLVLVRGSHHPHVAGCTQARDAKSGEWTLSPM